MAKSVKYLLKIRQASIFVFVCQTHHFHWYLSKDFQTVSTAGVSLINTEACKSKESPLRLTVLAAKNIVLSGENFKLETKSANLVNLTIVVRVVTAMNYLLRKNA